MRISLISVVYCSLDTPARSAAPYAQVSQAKPSILGLNFESVLIIITFSSQTLSGYIIFFHDISFLCGGSIDLIHHLVVGIVLQ